MTWGVVGGARVMLVGGAGSMGAPVSVLIFAVTLLVATLILRRSF